MVKSETRRDAETLVCKSETETKTNKTPHQNKCKMNETSRLTVRRTLQWPPNKVFLQIVHQSGCVNLIDNHASLQSSHSCKLKIVAWVVELTYLHVIVKCESLLGGHCKARCTVIRKSCRYFEIGLKVCECQDFGGFCHLFCWRFFSLV